MNICKVAFLCILACFLMTSNALEVKVDSTSQQIDTIREMLKNSITVNNIKYDVEFPEIEYYWNPQLITDDLLLTELCSNNLPGNYQNPFNCNQFIMCTSDGSAYVWECPGNGQYDPFADCCVYQPQSVDGRCPWWSGTWNDLSAINCETVGQRPYWSYLTLPAIPQERCCRDVLYCKNFQTSGSSICPLGFGFSRSYLACLQIDNCHKIDDIFNL